MVREGHRFQEQTKYFKRSNLVFQTNKKFFCFKIIYDRSHVIYQLDRYNKRFLLCTVQLEKTLVFITERTIFSKN